MPSGDSPVVDPTDSSKPTVRAKSITITFSGDALDRTKGNWKKWSAAIRLDLDMMALGSHIDPRRCLSPNEDIRPTSYDNWLSNDLAVRSFIAKNCTDLERELFENIATARKCWEALEAVHLAEGPVKQMELIRSAFNSHVVRGDDQVVKARKIVEDIQRAFDMPGGLSRDVFICITLLTVLGDGHDHTRSIILRDMQNATASNPFLPRQLISYLEADLQLLLGDAHRASSSTAIALAAKPAPNKSRVSVVCSNCQKPNHTHPYCISVGGGMARKTIEESKTARKQDREAGKAVSGSVSGGKPKHKVQITTTSGQAFVLELDEDVLASAAPAQKTEFAGMVYSTDALEWDQVDGFAHMAFVKTVRDEEEVFTNPSPVMNHTTNIDWTEASQDVDFAKITVATLNQNSKTIISLTKFPFYVDSGASIYVSPDKSDFYCLKRIEPQQVGGVGTASVTAIGMGDIHLRIGNNTTLILCNALYIPGATVRLISVSAITRDSNINILFDHTSCYLIDRTSNAHIARGSLTTKRLYSLDLHNASTDHIFTAIRTAGLETWHRQLGHANYQAIQEMARKGIVKGMPSTFLDAPSTCESCVFGKQTRTPVPKKCEEGPGHKATRKLGKVWIDLTGPTHVKSRNGNTYIMNILDDFTDHAWSIPLADKSSAYPRLKEWEIARENETGLKVGIYRVDNGELKSEQMDGWI